ncbi:MAG: hypothetical protein M1838_000286 [Thelocarpon superellum]|nr:MAG: hypothetical protein M1838_000286 [Thelocarpon superellum]
MAEDLMGGPFERFITDIDSLSSEAVQTGLKRTGADAFFSGYHATAMDSCLDPALNPNNPGLPPVIDSYFRMTQGDPRNLVHPSPTDLSILSAETHQDVRAMIEPRTSPGNVVLGVLINDDPGQEPAAREELPEASAEQEHRPRKRSKANSQDAEDGSEAKKSRGRPRLDIPDESATDRRRTQIRLAQRAYRMRKETTIASLQNRVSQLEGTIDEMNKAFLDFNDRAIGLGVVQLSPALAKSLHKTTQRFLSLTQVVTPTSEPEEELSQSGATSFDAGLPPIPVAGPGDRVAVASLLDCTTSTSRASQGDDHSSPSQSLTTASSPFHFGSPGRTAAVHTQNQLSNVNRTLARIVSGAPSSPRPMIQPHLHASTYAYEPQFGRRLQRATLEAAYELLVSPQTPGGLKDRVFQYSYCGDNLDGIARQIMRGLESLNAPVETTPSTAGCGPITFPQKLLEAEGSPPPAEETTIYAPPFEVEWLTPYGVEDYLRKKGIEVNNDAPYAEFVVEESPSPRGGSNGTGTSTSGGEYQSPPKTPPRERQWTRNGFIDPVLFPGISPTACEDGYDPVEVSAFSGGSAGERCAQGQATRDDSGSVDSYLPSFVGAANNRDDAFEVRASRRRAVRAVDLAVLFKGRNAASPLTSWLRVPLSWYHSSTYAFFPDENHASIRRKYTSPTAPDAIRQFCGFCGTPLSYWSENPRSEAEFISLTLGSLTHEDLLELDEWGMLPPLSSTPSSEETREEDQERSSSQPEADTETGAETAVFPKDFHPSTTATLPWFDSMMKGSLLGRNTHTHRTTRAGVAQTPDGRTRVEWEVVEWNEGDQGEADSGGITKHPVDGHVVPEGGRKEADGAGDGDEVMES